MPLIGRISRLDRKPLAVVLRIKHYLVALLREWINRNLHLDIGRNADIENLPMSGKPGIGPAAIIADANRRDGIDHAQGQCSRRGGAGSHAVASILLGCLLALGTARSPFSRLL